MHAVLCCPAPPDRHCPPPCPRHFVLHDKLLHPGVPLNPRLVIMAALITVWGSRLTYNFARKGGYRFDAEDYRWGGWGWERQHDDAHTAAVVSTVW